MGFFLNTKKHYKIWFSGNPNSFLSMEDQLRFIRMRTKNPDATLSFVYSSKKLNAKSQAALKEFCKKYQITPQDFDTDLPKLLTDEQDKKLYDLANKELNEPGGNLAAASDCVRLMIPVIDNLGIYSDFDLSVDFSKKPSLMPVKSPVVLPATVEDKKEMKSVSFDLNIDFLAVAKAADEKKGIAPEAIKSIRAIQAKVIEKYAAPYAAFITPAIHGLGTVMLREPFCLAILQKYFKLYPNASIFQLRKYLLTSKDAYTFPTRDGDLKTDAAESAGLRHCIFREAVISFSGANAYYALYAETFPKDGFRITQAGIAPKDHWDSFITAMKNSSLEANDLTSAVMIKTNFQTSHKPEAENISQGLRDGSWTVFGNHQKAKREQKIVSVAGKLASHWRKKKELQNAAKPTLDDKTMPIWHSNANNLLFRIDFKDQPLQTDALLKEADELLKDLRGTVRRSALLG